MTAIDMTRHAKVRSQQRAIPPLILEWLLEYGHRAQAQGCERVTFDREARRELEGRYGKRAVSMLSKYMSVAAIVAEDETVVTAYWLH